MAQKPETRLRTKIQKAIQEYYGDYVWFFHPHGSQFGSGAPDIVGVVYGYFFGLEVKTPQNSAGMTKGQAAAGARILWAQGIFAEVKSIDQALEVISDGIEEAEARASEKEAKRNSERVRASRGRGD